MTISLLTYLTVVVSLSGTAQMDSIDISGLELDEIVVTGTRVPKHLKESPVQTKVISSEDIKRANGTDIKDVLQETMPGIEFSYTMNQQTHMNFGSFGGQSVLFLVDGERLAGETMDDVDFSRIDMANVDHIEVIRGASSALYGSNAAGGVINIITRKPEAKTEGDLDILAGKHNERRYSAALRNGNGKISNSFSASASRIDSYDVTSEPGAETRVFSTVYGSKVLNVKENIFWKPTESIKLRARGAFYMREIPKEIWTPERYRSYTAGAGFEWNIGTSGVLDISYSFDQYDKSQLLKRTDLDIRTYSDVLNSVKALYNHTLSNGSVLSVGADYAHEYLLNSRLDDGIYKSVSFDSFAQIDWKISNSIEAVGALRYDYYQEGNISRITPKISIRYTPAERLTLRAAWGMGFRTPTLKEKYYNFDMAGIWTVRGNPDLRPENSHNIDISADYTIRSYSFTLCAFHNNVKERIATGLPYSLPQDPNELFLDYINLSDYRSYGCEFTAKGAWICGLRASVSYSYTHECVMADKDGNGFNNQFMPARPHCVTANAGWTKDLKSGYNFSVYLSGRFLSAIDNREYINLYDISEGTTNIHYPSYGLLKLSVSQTIASKFTVTLTADNLTNYKPKYYYLNAPLTDGISFSAGLNYSF